MWWLPVLSSGLAVLYVPELWTSQLRAPITTTREYLFSSHIRLNAGSRFSPHLATLNPARYCHYVLKHPGNWQRTHWTNLLDLWSSSHIWFLPRQLVQLMLTQLAADSSQQSWQSSNWLTAHPTFCSSVIIKNRTRRVCWPWLRATARCCEAQFLSFSDQHRPSPSNLRWQPGISQK
jgi:hypothetical protein